MAEKKEPRYKALRSHLAQVSEKIGRINGVNRWPSRVRLRSESVGDPGPFQQSQTGA